MFISSPIDKLFRINLIDEFSKLDRFVPEVIRKLYGKFTQNVTFTSGIIGTIKWKVLICGQQE